MRIAKCHLESVSTYQQRKYYQVEKIDDGKESHDDYEKRTWRESAHCNGEGAFIPPMCFKLSLLFAATMLDLKIPGKGNAKYKKHFAAGVMVTKPLLLGVEKEDIKGVWVHVPADGRPGGSKRVPKCFPTFDSWEGEVEYMILDETITKPVFEQHLMESGRLVGIGVFRPQNRGYHGMFKVNGVEWSEAV